MATTALSFICKRKKKYHCKVCDIDISGNVKTHAKERNHIAAEKEHGCDYVLYKGNCYYCDCCNLPLNSRPLALEHILQKKHRINANLPCISIALTEIGNYHCAICDIDIDNEINLENHVKTEPHIFARRKYGCDQVTHMRGNLYTCSCCDSTLTSRKLASDHVKEEEHVNNTNLPCISLACVTTNEHHCKICNRDIGAKANFEVHLRGRGHVAARKKYGCDYVSLKDNLYYCACCGFTFPSRQLATNHIAEENHRNIANLPCISITCVGTATNLYRCDICNTDVLDKQMMETHVRGEEHVAIQKTYGCDNIVLKDNLYYCECCCSTLPNRASVHFHIKRKSHSKTVGGSKNEDQSTVQNIPEKAQSTEKNSSGSHIFKEIDTAKQRDAILSVSGSARPFSDYIVNVEGSLNCVVCGCMIIDHTKVNDHINENEHVTGVRKFREHRIFYEDNGYHCKCCDRKIVTRKQIYEHMAGKNHNRILEALKDNLTKTIVARFGDDQISFKGYMYYCKRCNCNISSSEHVSEHVKGKNHKKLLKASNPEDKPPEQIPPEFGDDQISFKDNKYYCKRCNCNMPSSKHVYDHLKGKNHKKLLQTSNLEDKPPEQIAAEFGDDQISFKDNKYYCKRCDCNMPSSKHVYDHLKGKNHNLSLEASKLEQAKSAEATDPTTRSKGTNVKVRRARKRPAKTIFKPEPGLMLCSVCNVSVMGAGKLHIHLAGHFSNDFVDSNGDKKKTEVTREDSQSAPIEEKNNAEVSRAKIAEADSVNVNEVAFVPKAEKPMNMKKILQDLNFEDEEIYSLREKTADIELGMKLRYPIDEERASYCLVCQKIVDGAAEDYPEHLRDLDHCVYLDKMEKDHRLFDDFPDQWSQLGLARQYMQETSDCLVRCFACDEDVDNVDGALSDHVDDENHRRRCVTLDAEAKMNFENVKPVCCDWYGVQRYWCVPCEMVFRQEVNFAKHLKSHVQLMKQKSNATRKLIIDFCTTCALMWYGYRYTWTYHCEVPSHVWLTRDGHYTSTEIPRSAKRLLIEAEKYIDEIVRHSDDASAQDRDKEATVIRDIEQSVSGKFRRAKAHTFGSRITGLASTDSDIDVFLDCGDMYDGADSSSERILDLMIDVHNILGEDSGSWNVEELLTSCRSPIIKAHHRVTGFSCDISFMNGLSVESTLLIKSFNDVFPSCRKIILLLKKWLQLCQLSGAERITSYALYWYVIFYLQKESVLPSVASLIATKRSSRIIAGWEVGVCRDFTCNVPGRNFGIKELLIGFFTFYANFDYRLDVACPLLGEVVRKRAFVDPQTLPNEMERYKVHVEKSGAALRIDSVMCVQDPFDLQHNLSKAISKTYLNRFRKYCSMSADVLRAS